MVAARVPGTYGEPGDIVVPMPLSWRRCKATEEARALYLKEKQRAKVTNELPK